MEKEVGRERPPPLGGARGASGRGPRSSRGCQERARPQRPPPPRPPSSGAPAGGRIHYIHVQSQASFENIQSSSEKFELEDDFVGVLSLRERG